MPFTGHEYDGDHWAHPTEDHPRACSTCFRPLKDHTGPALSECRANEAKVRASLAGWPVWVGDVLAAVS